MQRRDFLRIMGLAASVATLPAQAKDNLPLVVWLTNLNEQTVEGYLHSVVKGLQDRGLVDGHSIRFEAYFANFSSERLAQLIQEIIVKKPAVCIVNGAAIRAMADATKTIPLVVGTSGDMVAAGLVASLAHPGGNVTGVQFMAIDLIGKRMELLKLTLPRIRRVTIIADPGHAGEPGERAKSIAVAKQLGMQADYKAVTNPVELQEALDSMLFSGSESMVAFPDAITFGTRKQIADFAIQNKLPTISGWDAYADAGFLLIYGPSLTAAWERMAYFVDRILKGAKPADLPAELPSVIELIVNLKTARALGIQVPESILIRANRVIE